LPRKSSFEIALFSPLLNYFIISTKGY